MTPESWQETRPAAAASAPGRLGVGVIGAGRVGAVLGAALRAAGHAVVGASGVSEESVTRLEAMLPGVPRLEPSEVVRRSELVLIAVPDDALADLVAGIAATGGWQAGQLVVHTSGRHGTAVLGPASAAGAIALAVHPAMTFTGTSLDLPRLSGAVMAVTAPATVLPIAQALVIEMGGEPVTVPEGARGAYHAALAHVANHLVTLVCQSMDLLEAAGVPDPGRVVGPLAAAALDNSLRAREAALTGPVARGDERTVAAHLDVLRGSAAEPAYRALAAATADLAVRGGRIRRDVRDRLVARLAAHAVLPAAHERDDQEASS